MKYTIILLSLFLVGCGGKYSDEDIALLSCEYESFDDRYPVGAYVNKSSEKFSLLVNKTRELVAFAEGRSLLTFSGEPLAFRNDETDFSSSQKSIWSAKEISPYASDSFNKEVIEWKEHINGGGDTTVSNRLYTNTLTLYSEYYVNSSNQVRAKYNCVKLDKEIEHMPDWELGEQNRL